MSFLTKIFGDPNTRVVAKFQPLVDSINGLESAMQQLGDEDLHDGGLDTGAKVAKTPWILEQAGVSAEEVPHRSLEAAEREIEILTSDHTARKFVCMRITFFG